jgi:TonB family protein
VFQVAFWLGFSMWQFWTKEQFMKKLFVTLAVALAIVATAHRATQASGQTQPGSSPTPKYTQEQIEEIKKQREKAGNTNALIQQAQNAMNAKNWQEAIPLLQQLVAMEPTEWQFYIGLGDAQLNLGQYDEAVESYQKGIGVAESNTVPSTDPAKKKAGVAKMLIYQGNAYVKLHRTNEAVAAFTRAAGMDPNPAVAYFNLCATQYNSGNMEGALDACDKAIAANPTKTEAYFIKASVLIAGSTTDQVGIVKAPPGTAEALKKYLELAPDGAHTPEVKQMLAFIGSRIEAASKKRKGVLPAVPPTRISSGLAEANLIQKVDIPYPSMARVAYVVGDVVLQAIINKQGTIEDLTLVSGHPLLIQAVMDAVRQWRYKPYLLKGAPVDVVTTITVKFHI